MLEFLDKMAAMERRANRYLPARTSRRSSAQAEIDWSLPTIELAPFLDPRLKPPRHLAQYGAVLDAAMVDADRESATTYKAIALAAPPQHGKTTTTECGILKALNICHGLSHAYATYSQDVTDRIERETRRMAEAVGLVIEGTRTDWWIPKTKSRIRWTSIGGSLTSYPVDGLLVVDDPFKDAAEARSVIERQTKWEWLVQVALRRLHPGAWLIEMATRWSEDDLTARMIDRMGVDYLNIQAICEDDNDGTGRELGEALWQQERPLEFLEQQKQADPIPFEGQYQGRPRALGDALFGTPQRFTTLPEDRLGFAEAYGTDLAYSKRDTADWSVLLRGRRFGEDVFVTHGWRKRVDATKFLEELMAQQEVCRAAIRFYHGGGGELGVTQLFQKDVPMLRAIQASSDKVVRSTAVRKAWNLGKVFVPAEGSPFYGPWVKDLLQEVSVFTGIGDANDDLVDGLAALYDELMATAGSFRARVRGQRRSAGGFGGF
jgi:phage terminase large subunit-like protein